MCVVYKNSCSLFRKSDNTISFNNERRESPGNKVIIARYLVKYLLGATATVENVYEIHGMTTQHE